MRLSNTGTLAVLKHGDASPSFLLTTALAAETLLSVSRWSVDERRGLERKKLGQEQTPTIDRP